jgi:hypothetical protein
MMLALRRTASTIVHLSPIYLYLMLGRRVVSYRVVLLSAYLTCR